MAVDDKGANAEAQLQATLNVIPAYAWYALPSGALTFVNERTVDYLGLPALRPALCATHEPVHRDDPFRDHECPCALSLAGQYPRTTEPDRAGCDPVDRARLADPPSGLAESLRHHHSQTTNHGRGRTSAHPGSFEGHETGDRGIQWRRRAFGHEPVYGAVPDEETWDR